MASTSTESSSNLDPQLLCTKCKELFNAPKILPCGHLMCHHCLLEHVQSLHASAQCPVCQIPISKDLKPQASAEELVDSFPSDLTMAKLVKAHRLLSKAQVCCMCMPREVTAESMCLNCGDMFCGSCKEKHTRQTYAKDHNLEDLKSLTADQLAARRPIICTEHEEVCNLYCCFHGAPMCVPCVNTTHRQCQNVVSMKERQKKASEELDDLTSKLTKAESQLKRRMENLDSHISNQSTCTKIAVGKINAMHRALVSAIDKRCKDLKEEVNRAAADARRQKNELSLRKAQLSEHITVTARGKPYSRYPSLAEFDPKLKSRVKQMSRLPTTLSNDFSSFKFTKDLKELRKAISRVGTLAPVSVPHASLEQSESGDEFVFHTMHGSNITLSTAKTAKRSPDIQQRDGVVLSRHPMIESMLYEVKIIKQKKRLFALGVMTTDPESHHVPSRLDNSDPFLLCLNIDGSVYAFGEKKGQNNRLKVMQQVDSSRLGLALDQSRNLHLFWNGKSQGVVASNIPQPAYFAMDLLTPCAKITATSLRRCPALMEPQAGPSTKSEDQKVYLVE